MMDSCIYRGTVLHQRFKPRGHRFTYPLYMLYLDLAELDQVFRGRLGWSMRWPSFNWYRRKDHLDITHRADSHVDAGPAAGIPDESRGILLCLHG